MIHVSIIAEKLGEFLGLPITNSLLTAWIAVVLLVGVALTLKRPQLVPRGLQNAVEIFIEFWINLVDSVLNDRKLASKVLPLVLTIFFFVLVNNWLGLLPGFGSIGFFVTHEGQSAESIDGETEFIPLFRAATSDLNTTIALALISVIITQILSIRALGGFRYAKRFLNFSSPINFFVGVLEFISELGKIVSFSFRLFGNIFAGEVLLLVMTALVPIIIPVPFIAFEIFVGVVQAFVFAMLTIIFIKLATTAGHETQDHGEERESSRETLVEHA
ncbi:MAG: F0F1 ATP synthase subunit A [Parcubacteria group bacterium]|nr:F0F1 ATP synthase subunit A [Parcubacteria group bacterium]